MATKKEKDLTLEQVLWNCRVDLRGYGSFEKNRNDIRSQLDEDLTVLLYKNGYPPEWDEEVFNQVMLQAENFKKYNG